MTELSPAAQAMMDAYIAGLATKRRSAITKRRLAIAALLIAALLRAAVAATQMRQYVDGSIEALGWICEANDLLAIADELEGGES
jgi:adenosylmethionine-8-amino-7-oxononanoate aminotransferase